MPNGGWCVQPTLAHYVCTRSRTHQICSVGEGWEFIFIFTSLALKLRVPALPLN